VLVATKNEPSSDAVKSPAKMAETLLDACDP